MHEITTRCREKINCTGRFMDDAGNLYKALFDLGDVKMWDLIEGVWVYMLCFSASSAEDTSTPIVWAPVGIYSPISGFCCRAWG
jgi:hypothetical protein